MVSEPSPYDPRRLAKFKRLQAGCFFVLLFVVAISALIHLSKPVPVAVVGVEKGPAVETVGISGAVESNYQPAAPTGAGKITEIYGADGAEVVEGEILARLDNPRNPAIVAPQSGVVFATAARVGMTVEAGQPLFLVRKCCNLRVAGETPAISIQRLVKGQEALVQSSATPAKTAAGELTEIIPLGVPGEDPYRLHVSLPLGARLEEGTPVDVFIVVQRDENALLVPTTALDGNVVWVVEGKRAFARPVSVGMISDEKVQITSGLDGTEKIVVSPPPELRDGRRVKVEEHLRP